MPSSTEIPEAVKAAEAVEQYLFECRNSESIVLVETERIATIIAKAVAPAKAKAVEAAFREGCEECNCPACRRNFDHAWKHSDARASLRPTEEDSDAAH